MQFFVGSGSQELGKKVAEKLAVPVGLSELIRFADGELKPVVKAKVRDEVCVFLQSTTVVPNDYWIELFLFVNALKKEAAKKIIAVIPAFGYARQNQQHQKGEPVSAHVMVQILETLGVNEVLTIDLHDETMTGMFNIPITNVSALPLLASQIKSNLTGQVVVVTPDQGGIERGRLFAQSLGEEVPVVMVEKKRDLQHAHQSEAVQVVGEVAGATAVIVDDIVTSGKTILNAIEALRQKQVNTIFVCVTHVDFTAEVAAKLQASPLNKMLVTNSVAISSAQLFPKLEIVDIADLLAAELKKILE